MAKYVLSCGDAVGVLCLYLKQTPHKRHVCYLAENDPDSQLSSSGRWKPVAALDCNFLGTHPPAILEWIVET
jgi:hypothetical protein